MKLGLHCLSFGVVSAVLLTIGCGNNASPILAAAATTSTGSGTTTSSGVYTQGYFPTLGLAASTIYVIEQDTSANYSVLEFSTTLPSHSTSVATVNPVATVNAPANTSFSGLAIDGQGYLYVSATNLTPPTTPEILVYAPGATGTATPVRTLTGPTLGAAIAVDASGQLYTYGGLGISVYAAGATGNAAPLRTIAGNQTLLAFEGSIAIDSAGNIYVAGTDATSILVFSSGANGNVAPASVIQGAATGIFDLYGLAVDSGGDIFVKAGGSSSDILEFATGANGNVSPSKKIEMGSPTTNLAADSSGDLFTITNLPTQPEVAFASLSILSAGLQPEMFSSTAWTNSPTGQIAVH
jgi:sugar lactone lactonase YvrE